MLLFWEQARHALAETPEREVRWGRSLANSLYDSRYQRLIELLVAARKQAGLTQRELATLLKQPHSYVGKLESLQRRIDLIELVDLLEALGVDPNSFLRTALRGLGKKS